MLYLDAPVVVAGGRADIPRCFRGRPSAHLMADSEDELLAYARRLGLRPQWIQYAGTPRVHFDLVGRRLEAALRDPNIRKLTRKEMALLIRQRLQTNHWGDSPSP